MKKIVRFGALCMALLMLGATAALAAAGIKDGMPSFTSEVAYNVNAQRAAIRVGSLTLDTSLNECARILAREMEGLKGDEAQRPNGKAWESVLDEQGYFYESGYAARNRYTSQSAPDSSTLVDYWLSSSGLRANTLNSAYTHTGIYGYYSETHDRYYVVQLFVKQAKVEAAGYVATANSDMLVYSGPSANYSVLWALARGAEVTVQSVVNGWAKFAVSNTYGYAPISGFTKVGSATPSPLPNPLPVPTVPAATDEGNYYATSTVNVRSGPSTAYGIVGELSYGDRVTVAGSSGNWYRINWNNAYAYVSSTYLRPLTAYSPPASSTPDGGYYATANVNVRSGPSTRYAVVGGLTAGQAVSVTGTSGSWYKIAWSSGTAYVSSAYLRSGSAPANTPAPVPAPGQSVGTIAKARANVNVRSGPSTKYKRLGLLYKGELVTIKGYEGSWARVEWRNYASAYVSRSYLIGIRN